MINKVLKLFIKKKFSCCGVGLKLFRGVVLHGSEKIEIGDNVAIGDYCVIWGGGGVQIGNDVLIAAHSVISSQSHDADSSLHRLTSRSESVFIEQNVWIGAGAIILPGVRIGRNSIIGAGAVVTKSIPANCVCVGNPARVIRHL